MRLVQNLGQVSEHVVLSFCAANARQRDEVREAIKALNMAGPNQVRCKDVPHRDRSAGTV